MYILFCRWKGRTAQKIRNTIGIYVEGISTANGKYCTRKKEMRCKYEQPF